MVKTKLLASIITFMALGSFTGIKTKGNTNSKVRDTRIIVEVNKSIEGLNEEQIISSQNAVLNSIRHNVTGNVKLVNSYTVLNNAFVIEINSDDVESVRNLPGVASVTVDTLHARTTSVENRYSVKLGTPDPAEGNISAKTMEKPNDTNDGEGTVIAILDNEFYLKGKTSTEDAWSHEVFTDLGDNVAKRFTFDNLTSTLRRTHAKRNSKAVAGDEGSLYFNSKVPFYYDYGGDTTSYAADGVPDFDVSSKISYHGSHVASIAAANAPLYEGIAPKAQLACMKVFTNFDSTKTADNMGFGDSSGAYDSCILSAIEDCIKLNVDGINMSLGSDLDDFDQGSITLKTLKNLADGGILTSISAGNSGKSSFSFVGGYGNWTPEMVETGILSSYANNASVMTIASGAPDKVFYETAIEINGINIAYEDQVVNREGLDDDYDEEYKLYENTQQFFHGEDATYEYVGGFGLESDYKASVDYNHKIVVVNRGQSAFTDKYLVAKSKNAAGLIIVNNDPTSNDFNFRCSFGDEQPEIPVALVLFKDKTVFEANPSGTFKWITKKMADNPNARTISTFSSDGATYNYDLKPDITAPGDIIAGAVPPQKSEDREETPYNTYQYLSGTSMSAPNYAGAQSVVLSTVSKDIVAKANAEERALSAVELKQITDYRKTVDMRMMSTANPMNDIEVSPESGNEVVTSPRIQGAGMVDLDGATKTKVYFEGYDAAGKLNRKSKVCLYNNDDIANGDIKLKFVAHNEDTVAHSYNAKISIMRPAIKLDNKIVKKSYNYRFEIEDIKNMPGVSYYDQYYETMKTGDGEAKVGDVIKLTKDIEYYKSKADFENTPEPIKSTYAMGYWVATAVNGKNVTWEVLPSDQYQSIQDVMIEEKTINQLFTFEPGDNNVTVDAGSLSEAAKDKILEFFTYGCPIEGYVTFTSTESEPELSIPYLGFYSGTDRDESMSYASAPVAEPFSFEKDPDTIYPSQLVNDLAIQLVGKDNINMESMWVTGYVDHIYNLNTDKVLSNDTNIAALSGFNPIGTDPYTGEQTSKLVAGNPEKTNTMLIQQFILRSVDDNYFEIRNKETGEMVYKSVLEDMLFGEQRGKYPLYKSHVDANYLSAGYVAHRAFASIPLYNVNTGVAFASGKYEITFNYLLAATQTWTKTSYEFDIDSEAPEFVGMSEQDDMVRFEFKDSDIRMATLGYNRVEIQYDEAKKVYYFEAPVATVLNSMNSLGQTTYSDGRIYLQATDGSYGTTGVIIHLDEEENFNKFTAVYGSSLLVNNDFTVENGELKFVKIVNKTESDVVINNIKTVNINLGNEEVVTEKGCKGSFLATSAFVFIASLVGACGAIYLSRKNKCIEENA